MTTNTEKNKLVLKALNDGDDIPFILCTPMKNENDDAAQAQDTTTDEAGSPKRKTFFLKPRRSCQCADCRHNNKKDVGPNAIADMLSESSLSGRSKGSANESMDMDCNTLHSSPRKSPVPIFQSFFNEIVTPRVINLLKIRPRLRASQEEQQQEDDDRYALMMAGPLFPILGRRHHHLLQQQERQQQQQCPVIQRPIPRHHR
jgi:hypothetical protein